MPNGTTSATTPNGCAPNSADLSIPDSEDVSPGQVSGIGPVFPDDTELLFRRWLHPPLNMVLTRGSAENQLSRMNDATLHCIFEARLDAEAEEEIEAMDAG